jgi:hypothetical protein
MMVLGLAQILILALVVGLIVLFVKNPKTGFTVLGVIGIILAAFFWVATVATFPVSKEVTVTEMTTYSPAATAVNVTNGHSIEHEELAAIWRDGIEDEFEVDIYPSQKAAARQLGRKVIELATKLNDGKEPQWFESSLSGDVSDEVLSEFNKIIKNNQSNPDNPILTSAKGLEGSVATVGLILRNAATGGCDHGKILAGMLEASANIKGKKSTVSAEFSNKPWLENFSAYCNSNPGRQYVVVRSKSSCTSAEWAQKEATTAASRVLAGKLHTKGMSGFSIDSADIEKYGFIADTFTQSLTGSVSDIWRQVILLDVSGDKMTPLMDTTVSRMKETLKAKVTEIQHKRLTWARMLISLAGLITVICVVYLIVNVATKGYYTLVLRLVTAAAIVIGAIVLFLLLANYA